MSHLSEPVLSDVRLPFSDVTLVPLHRLKRLSVFLVLARFWSHEQDGDKGADDHPKERKQ